jgi:hypothetical protein
MVDLKSMFTEFGSLIYQKRRKKINSIELNPRSIVPNIVQIAATIGTCQNGMNNVM